ncbi:MAG: hypothetical protein EX258_06750 [Sphingomonadaceae bacterium]|nr:MAG: hypothetical protein EX258_06750 [Sphingomonadaceae bacterium]
MALVQRRPTHIPHIPGLKRRGVNVPDLPKWQRITSPKARTSDRKASWPANWGQRSDRKNNQSGCGFPFWLIILAFIGWNMVGKDVDSSWVLEQMRKFAN